MITKQALRKAHIAVAVSARSDLAVSSSKDCPWMISLIFRMQNYKKIDVRGYPQIFIDNLSNLNNNILI